MHMVHESHGKSNARRCERAWMIISFSVGCIQISSLKF